MIWITVITGLQDLLKGFGKAKTEMVIIIAVLFLVIMFSCDQMFDTSEDIEQCQRRSIQLLSELEGVF